MEACRSQFITFMVEHYYIYGRSVYYFYGKILLHLRLVDLLHLCLKVITLMVFFFTFMGDNHNLAFIVFLLNLRTLLEY